MDQRKVPPQDAAQRVVRAVEQLAAARAERDQAIAAALNAGGSIRQVADLAGMSPTQINVIGKANGWPDAQTLKRRQDERNKRVEWDELMATFEQIHRAYRAGPDASKGPGLNA